MISPELLDLLQCPEGRQPLRIAPAELIAQANQAISARRLHNRAGELLERTLDGGLLREDGQLLYPVYDEIPVLLVDEAIEAAAIAGG